MLTIETLLIAIMWCYIMIQSDGINFLNVILSVRKAAEDLNNTYIHIQYLNIYRDRYTRAMIVIIKGNVTSQKKNWRCINVPYFADS